MMMRLRFLKPFRECSDPGPPYREAGNRKQQVEISWIGLYSGPSHVSHLSSPGLSRGKTALQKHGSTYGHHTLMWQRL